MKNALEIPSYLLYIQKYEFLNIGYKQKKYSYLFFKSFSSIINQKYIVIVYFHYTKYIYSFLDFGFSGHIYNRSDFSNLSFFKRSPLHEINQKYIAIVYSRYTKVYTQKKTPSFLAIYIIEAVFYTVLIIIIIQEYNLIHSAKIVKLYQFFYKGGFMNVNSQDAPIYNFILSGAFVKVITRNVQQYNLKLSLEDAEGEVCLYIAQQINNGQLNKTITNKEAINKIINKALKEYQRKNICRCQQADFPNYKNHKCKGNILTHHECEKYTEEMFDQMKVSYAMYDEIGMFGNQKMWGDKEKAEYFRNERNLSLSKISRDLRPALEQIISMDRRKEVKNLNFFKLIFKSILNNP